MSPSANAPSKTLGVLSAGLLTLSMGLAGPGFAVAVRAAAQDHQLPELGTEQTTQAQQSAGETRPPSYIASIEGTARVDREGGTEPAERGLPMVPGDRLRTDAGRVELAFPNNTQVYVDRYTELELVDMLAFRLARGRLFVRIGSTIDHDQRLVIDAPGATVQFTEDGEYRVGVGGADAVEVEVAALRGTATLASEGGNVMVPQGQRAMVRDGQSPTTPEWFNASQTTLERWAADREALWQSGNYASRQYLPSELSEYAGTFDRYGSWQNDETYGSVWYPSSTTEDWRPYNDGRWDYTGTYGWTWVAYGSPWAYPTHHYGRWQIGSRGWFWVPSRHWGSAWVYWAISPGYVGWCPLGWNGRPVLNVFNYDRTYASRSRDPYRAWSVIPRDSFGRPRPTYADRALLARERPAFVLQHVAPGFAPPRSPYPSPFMNDRVAGSTQPFRGGTSAPRRDPNPDRSPRSYGAYGSTKDDRGGHPAPPSEDGSPQTESPYERAQPYMTPPRPDDDRTNTYRRVPSSEAPVRSPYGNWRDRRERDRDGDDDNGRGGPGYAGPGYRVPNSPGMSRPADSGGRRPGMSDAEPGEPRRAVPRNDPPPRRDDDNDGRGRGSSSRPDNGRSDSGSRGAAPRDPGGSRDAGPRDQGSRSGGDTNRSGGSSGSSSSGSSGGAVRRHP